jgi:tetrahydromethanopterin S-methyltransferase subunit G
MNEDKIVKKILKGLEPIFTSIDGRFESIDQRFESMDQRFESMDQRFNESQDLLEHFALSVSQEFTKVNERLDKNERSVAFLKHEVVQNGDALAQLSKKLDSETAATWSHLRRLDRQTGLTS